jgi:uncharacterized membrane protein YebE (DUF533 family)
VPAIYYESAEVRPLFPKWVPLGCGAASICALVLLFVGGSLASRGSFSKVFAFALGSMEGEMTRMYAADVKPVQKTEFAANMKTLRERLDHEQVALGRVQPLLQTMRDAVSDGQVTSAELERINAQVRAANGK